MPCVFLENNIVVGLDPNDPLYVDYRKNFSGEPTGKDNPELLRMHPSVGHAGSIVNGVPRIGFQKGGKAAQWRDEDMAQLFLQKAKQFVVDNKERPFFFIMACISRMCLEYLMNVLLASRVWGLAEMLFSKLIGVLMSF